jgi:hypothetical protein
MLPVLSKQLGLFIYLFIYWYLFKVSVYSWGTETLNNVIIGSNFLGGNEDEHKLKYPHNIGTSPEIWTWHYLKLFALYISDESGIWRLQPVHENGDQFQSRSAKCIQRKWKITIKGRKDNKCGPICGVANLYICRLSWTAGALNCCSSRSPVRCSPGKEEVVLFAVFCLGFATDFYVSLCLKLFQFLNRQEDKNEQLKASLSSGRR